MWQENGISVQPWESAIPDVGPQPQSRPGQYYEGNLTRNTEPASLSLVVPEFLTHRSYEILNICIFFKLLTYTQYLVSSNRSLIHSEKFHMWSGWWAGHSTCISPPYLWPTRDTPFLTPEPPHCAAPPPPRASGIFCQGFPPSLSSCYLLSSVLHILTPLIPMLKENLVTSM